MERRDPKARAIRQLILFGMLAVVFVPACTVGTALYLDDDWVPESTRSRLPGSTKDEVRAMLGEPDRIDDGHEWYSERWHYRRAGRLAEFRVEFDRDGRADEGSYDR
jgi:outer membrane protein assembly factor BamE (lipoprotein component of BamABCDE complex)